MKLQVLLVEDNPEDMEQYTRDLPEFFKSQGYEVDIDAKATFDEGSDAAKNPLTRYDLVISDTYKGNHDDRNAAVLSTINEYRNGKFCPLVVMSSGVCPDEFEETPFVKWVDKGDPTSLEKQIGDLLDTGIPQSARKLHDELDNVAGKYLWEFIDKNWEELRASAEKDEELIERIVRRRAAIALSDLIPLSCVALNSRYGLEYYVYPALDHVYYSLGDILVDGETEKDFRVILTPHCYLFPQNNTNRDEDEDEYKPKAEHILTVKTVPIIDVLGQKIENEKSKPKESQFKKLGQWTQSPAQTRETPEGRHWYLPKFLEIPHLYCDFLQVESVSFESLYKDYRRIATLLPPYAEALQECFTSFYGSVGIPAIEPKSIKDIIDGS